METSTLSITGSEHEEALPQKQTKGELGKPELPTSASPERGSAEKNQGDVLFTQEQVNRILAEERRKSEKRAQKQQDATRQEIIASYEERITDLTNRFEALQRSLEEKERAMQQAEIQAKKAQRQAEIATLAASMNVKTEAIPDVVRLFPEDVEGSLEEAFQAFLKERPYLLIDKTTKPITASQMSATNPANSDNSNLSSWHPLLRGNSRNVFGG